MIVGVDFDNTIVSYDALFHKVAVEQGLIPQSTEATKSAVKQRLCEDNLETEWTRLQGVVYGPRIKEAVPYPGVQAVLRCCHDRGIRLRIISHKTRHPFIGEPYDLHQAAREWLEHHHFFDPAGVGFKRDEAFFELTKEAKLSRIREAGCTHFIDDLREILLHPEFPADVRKLLFDPSDALPNVPGGVTTRSWLEIADLLLGEHSWEAAACALAEQPFSKLQPLPGGANNQVYSLGDSLILKRYFQDPADPRDRFKTERAFYQYAETAAPVSISPSLAWSDTYRLGLFRKIEGSRPQSCQPDHLDAAIDFIGRLNALRFRTASHSLAPASEACFSIEKHLQTVQRRVSRLREWTPLSPFASALVPLALNKLPDTFERLKGQLHEEFSEAQIREEIPESQRCISPSDFGFHNCIESSSGAVRFIDFEYAGWDDPAKLVCDFFCQPEIPAPANLFSEFILKIAEAVRHPEKEKFIERCLALLPFYRIKWTCIILNDLAPNDRKRRTFSFSKEPDLQRLQSQIEKAYKMADLI